MIGPVYLGHQHSVSDASSGILNGGKDRQLKKGLRKYPDRWPHASP